MSSLPRKTISRFRRFAPFVLAAYWIIMFAGTHIPATTIQLPQKISDKSLHFIGYFGLAFLLAFWRRTKRPLTFIDYLRIWGLIAAYGAFDERSQLLVGRNAELFDWLADITGALLGLVIFRFSRRAISRFVHDDSPPEVFHP